MSSLTKIKKESKWVYLLLPIIFKVHIKKSKQAILACVIL